LEQTPSAVYNVFLQTKILKYMFLYPFYNASTGISRIRGKRCYVNVMLGSDDFKT